MLNKLNSLYTSRNIAISGVPGSGKSTVVKRLQEITGKDVISAGSLFRQRAIELGLTLEEMNNSDTSEFDAYMDKYISDETGKSTNFIIDARFSAKFAKRSFKVFLWCKPDVAVSRINESNRDTESNVTIESLKTRIMIEESRAVHKYSFNPYDLDNYDCIIDTTCLSVDDIAGIILTFKAGAYVCPISIYPTQSIRDLSEDSLNGYIKDSYPIYNLITVKYDGDKFLISDGHRRFISDCLRGKKYIQCDIADHVDSLRVQCQADYDDLCKLDRDILE